MPESSLTDRYLGFRANSEAAFAQYPEVEPLRLFVFKKLLVQRRADGWPDHVKRWVRPFLRRARAHLADRRAEALIWVESDREAVVDAVLPVYRELVARDIDTELISFYGPPTLPAAARVFAFPARARAPAWARGAWQALCQCEAGLRDRGLESSFYHVAAMLKGLYDELHRVLDRVAPRVTVCATTQMMGGAALMVASRLHGVDSLLLQHGMPGPEFTPLPADSMLVWGPVSEDIMASFGVPPARLLTVGSPRHDTMKPAGDGRARATLLRSLGVAERPTFVFFSQGHDRETHGDALAACARWLEHTAAQYAHALNVVVRLHPCEDGSLYRGCQHLKVMDRAVPLAIALEGCDWIGSLSSTTLYDGLLYGKPAWQFYADPWPVVGDHWRRGLAQRVSSERQLNEMVRDMLSRGVEAGSNETLVARVFANHGRASQAVADVVEARLGRRLAQEVAGCDRSS